MQLNLSDIVEIFLIEFDNFLLDQILLFHFHTEGKRDIIYVEHILPGLISNIPLHLFLFKKKKILI